MEFRELANPVEGGANKENQATADTGMTGGGNQGERPIQAAPPTETNAETRHILQTPEDAPPERGQLETDEVGPSIFAELEPAAEQHSTREANEAEEEENGPFIEE